MYAPYNFCMKVYQIPSNLNNHLELIDNNKIPIYSSTKAYLLTCWSKQLSLLKFQFNNLIKTLQCIYCVIKRMFFISPSSSKINYLLEGREHFPNYWSSIPLFFLFFPWWKVINLISSVFQWVVFRFISSHFLD